MRGVRSLLVLLVALAGLGAYLYFVEMKREPGEPADKRAKVFAVEAEKIDELTIRSESRDQTTLRKNGTEWQVVAPADGGPSSVDGAEVSGITTNLATLEEQRVVEDNAQDLKEFGLAEPRIEVAFKAGGVEQKLQIGAKTPTGSDLYAKVAGKARVFLISSFLDSTFNRRTFDLRDKTALKVDADKVDGLEVTTPDGTLRFAKVNGNWQLTAPAETRTDVVAISGLVSRLGTAQMKSIASGSDLKEYGLDTPAATLRIGSGSSQATLLIGKAAEEGTVYAKDGARPTVFTIESAIAEDVKKKAGDYRQKDLFDARAFNTTRVEITRAAQTVVFEQSGEAWKQMSPSAKDADATKVGALLSAITGARATAFLAKAPVVNPELTVALKFDGGKDERVSFYKQGDEALAVRAGSGDAAKIDAPLIDDIIKALEALK
ncbi:MAG: DUF4340 domain-containing protein [Acidobacteria bacterium]|nr:DUF4340 domain-containing protein [Acidobacteriota bacterium]